MSVTRPDRSDDVFYEQSALVREIREEVADQLHDLVVERQELGTPHELFERVQAVGRVQRQINQAIGRQRQAEEMGLAQGPHVKAEKEARQLLRQTVMLLGSACAAFVVAEDFEGRKHELEVGG